MKKLIVAACAAIASAVALASTVESSNIFGVLKVDTENTTNEKKQFMISVPWVAVGAGSDIDPTALVLASNLTDGDMLYVYGAAGQSTSKPFGAWKVSSGAWGTSGVSTSGSTYTTGEDTTVARGISVVVETAQRYIYLSGQYADSASSVTITVATSSDGKVTPAYTLIGGNFASDVDLNSGVAYTSGENTATPNAKDEIRLSLGEVYTWNSSSSKWQKQDGTTTVTIGNESREIPKYTTDNVKIPAGRGAWYVRRGTDALTMTFSGVSE